MSHNLLDQTLAVIDQWHADHYEGTTGAELGRSHHARGELHKRLIKLHADHHFATTAPELVEAQDGLGEAEANQELNADDKALETNKKSGRKGRNNAPNEEQKAEPEAQGEADADDHAGLV